jgi:hypothetical protein
MAKILVIIGFILLEIAGIAFVVTVFTHGEKFLALALAGGLCLVTAAILDAKW